MLDEYYRRMSAVEGVASERRLRHQMPFLYKNMDFAGKTVLDIGGGVGLHSLYACANGAMSATIIEPEGDGGHSAMIATFNKLKEALGAKNAELIQTTFQAFNTANKKYDVVLIQDAINHFDEPACVTLHTSPESQATYDEIFRSISGLINPGGYLSMSDCSSENLFPRLGLRNPFDLNIEWHKHQPPSRWAKLAERHGLELVDLRWSTPARLGGLGQALFGSSFASWFFTSHFIATFRKR